MFENENARVALSPKLERWKSATTDFASPFCDRANSLQPATKRTKQCSATEQAGESVSSGYVDCSGIGRFNVDY